MYRMKQPHTDAKRSAAARRRTLERKAIRAAKKTA